MIHNIDEYIKILQKLKAEGHTDILVFDRLISDIRHEFEWKNREWIHNDEIADLIADAKWERESVQEAISDMICGIASEYYEKTV